jgi:hypothetical protein
VRRQFTIELCVDYADQDKNDVIRAACQRAARHLYATAALLQDGTAPQIAISSDEFVCGHKPIDLLDGTGQQEPDMLGRVEEEQVSKEMLIAPRETK